MGALAELERRLQNTSALIVRYEHAINSPDNSESKTSLNIGIRSLQKLHKRLEDEFLAVAAIEEKEVYRYRIIESREPPSLGGIAEGWSEFQKLFETVYRKLTKQDMPSALGYSYCFAGSVGVVVTLPKLPHGSSLLTGDPINDASKVVFDLIESKDISRIARDLGPEPIEAVSEWLAVHIRHGYGLGLEWKSNLVTKRSVEIPASSLQALQTSITETTTDITIVLDGELFSVNTEKKTFEIRPDSGEDKTIEGTFTDAITPEHAASVPSRYRATVIKTVQMAKTKKEKPVTYFLQKLETL